MTHTYAILEISPSTYDEIERLLKGANYNHAFHEESHGADREQRSVVIDMHGIALKRGAERPTTKVFRTAKK